MMNMLELRTGVRAQRFVPNIFGTLDKFSIQYKIWYDQVQISLDGSIEQWPSHITEKRHTCEMCIQISSLNFETLAPVPTSQYSMKTTSTHVLSSCIQVVSFLCPLL